MLRILIGHATGQTVPYDRTRFDARCVSVGADGVSPPKTIAEMISQCPPGWVPDVYWHASLVHFPIPADIEEFEGLTATNIQDWHRGGRAVWAGHGFFDLILTEQNACGLLNAMGFEHAEFARLWGADPKLHRRLPNVERDIDVLFIGAMNPSVWLERNRWLDRLAKLGDRHRVLIDIGHYGEDYVKLTNRAKIVFNRSVNGCTNQRAYDGSLCGALVFNEAENTEVAEIFEDGVDHVTYDADNFEERLTLWLSDEMAERREAVIASAERKVREAHTEEAHQNLIFGALASNQDLRYRPSAEMPDGEKCWRKALQIFSQSHVGGAFEAFDLLDLAEKAEFDPSAIAEARAAINGWLARYTEPGREQNRLLTNGIVYAKEAAKRNSRNPFAQMTLGFLLLHRAEATQGMPPAGRNDIIEAAVAISQAAELCEVEVFEAPDGDKRIQLEGFGYPRWSDQFDCLVDRAYLQRGIDADAWREELCRTLAWRCRSMLSDLAGANGQADEALRQAQAASADLPEEAEALLRLARCEAFCGHLPEAANHYYEGLNLSPFSVNAWPELVSILKRLNLEDEAKSFVAEREQVIDCIPTFEAVRPLLREALQ